MREPTLTLMMDNIERQLRNRKKPNITAKWLTKGHAEDFFECSNCSTLIDCYGKGNPPCECPKCHAYMVERKE